MEGRFSKGLLYVLTNCKDPAKEEELNQWFNQTHFPDMTTSGIFTTALRFRNVSPSLDPHEARYAALYETEHDDLAEVMQKLDALLGDLHQRGRIHPALEMVHVALYRGMDSGFQTRATGQKTRGIMVMESDCSDPSREEEFNRWYDDIHLPDVLSTGLYHAA